MEITNMEMLLFVSIILIIVGLLCILIGSVGSIKKGGKYKTLLFIGIMLLIIGVIIYSLIPESTPTNPLPPNNTPNLPGKVEKITPFEIIEPKDGDQVDYKSTVSGRGANPGSLVEVYIMSKYGTYLQATTYPAEDGNWTCNNVQIGQYGSQSAGQNFTIFAEYSKDNKSTKTTSIDVIRS